MIRFFTFITELVGWLRIAASPTFISLVPGVLAWHFIPSPFGTIIAIAVIVAGVVLGATWATREWKRKGTIHFLSRTMATPELDEDEEKVKFQMFCKDTLWRGC